MLSITTSVTDLEAPGLDSTNGGRANDGHTLLLSNVGDLTGATLGHALSNDRNGLDLGVLHQLHGGAVDTAGRGKVDHDVDIGVLAHGLINLLVDGQQSLAGAPVHLGDELTAEGVDNASN